MATKFKSSVEIDGYLSLTSGNWVQVPDGTTLQRPGSPAVGMFRYNTTTFEFEGYFGATPAWGAIGGGGGTVTEAFKTIAVSGQSDIVADSGTDTLNVAAGSNVTLTTNAATDTLTIGSTSSGGVVTVERNNYTANGSTTAFGVSSTIASENNIQIYLDGVYQDKDTFTIAGTTVTLGTAPPNTTEVEIMHFVSVDGVIEVDEFVGDGTTTSFNTSLSIINENATQVYISGVYQSKSTYQTTGNDVAFTTAPPNGSNIEVVHVKALALSGFEKNNFTGTGSQTAFTLNQEVNEENMTFVFMQGVYQDKSTYGISGTTLTFATAPQNGYTIEVMVLGSISASTNALYTNTFTGNGSTTAYALGITPVDLNAVEVYLNGLYQNVSTLTLTANTLTFATAPPNGVIIEVRSVGFLNSGGTLAPATLTGGTGIDVVTNAPNNFTINNTLIDVTVSWATPSGQSATYTVPSPQSSLGQSGSLFPSTTFEISRSGYAMSGTAVLTGLPTGVTIASQSYNGSNTVLTITLGGVYPSANSLNTGIIVSGLTYTLNTVSSFYLFVAGGAGGASGSYTNSTGGGGGGAGGYLTNYGGTAIDLIGGTNYTVTVGAGGAGGDSGASTATAGLGKDGNNSVFSIYTATGGGGGAIEAAGYRDGRPGGSGGGSSNTGTGGTGSQGNDGGDTTNSNGAGGGGHGSAGANNTTWPSPGASGGTGTSNSITGSATFYAGGGGGGGYNSSGGGAGGSSIGGNGGSGSVGANGIVNTGSGGGGSDNYSGVRAGGSGGSGIVILRYPNTFTITEVGGSGLTMSTATSGSDKITSFTAGTGNIQFN